MTTPSTAAATTDAAPDTGTGPLPLSPGQRAAILDLARHLTPRERRSDHTEVIGVFAPILAWAQEAATLTDLQQRITAVDTYVKMLPATSPSASNPIEALTAYYHALTFDVGRIGWDHYPDRSHGVLLHLDGTTVTIIVVDRQHGPRDQTARFDLRFPPGAYPIDGMARWAWGVPSDPSVADQLRVPFAYAGVGPTRGTAVASAEATLSPIMGKVRR